MGLCFFRGGGGGGVVVSADIFRKFDFELAVEYSLSGPPGGSNFLGVFDRFHSSENNTILHKSYFYLFTFG